MAISSRGKVWWWSMAGRSLLVVDDRVVVRRKSKAGWWSDDGHAEVRRRLATGWWSDNGRVELHRWSDDSLVEILWISVPLTQLAAAYLFSQGVEPRRAYDGQHGRIPTQFRVLDKN
ncbi:hypothetical protein MA16_Dca019901 [Dendrobium catenatum]|uniref:Uncharacterized protein n=1 Tax=Dendrobium catenatum TaxID=906689 RepID=A0A2I0WXL7_9ASPA|nr:hypothetical protein MA16_Dca019901 [Dendrobium catenatum]